MEVRHTLCSRKNNWKNRSIVVYLMSTLPSMDGIYPPTGCNSYLVLCENKAEISASHLARPAMVLCFWRCFGKSTRWGSTTGNPKHEGSLGGVLAREALSKLPLSDNDTIDLPELTYSELTSPPDTDRLYPDGPRDLSKTESDEFKILSPKDDALFSMCLRSCSSSLSFCNSIDDEKRILLKTVSTRNACKPVDMNLHSVRSIEDDQIKTTNAPAKTKKPRLILRVRPPMAKVKPKTLLRLRPPKSKSRAKPMVSLRLRQARSRLTNCALLC